MKQAWGIVILVVSLLFLIIRLARCGNKMDKMQWNSGQSEYFAACQNILDSTYYVFKPLATMLGKDEIIDENVLTRVTSQLYDFSAKAGRIDAFNDEGGYYKKRVVDFIEFERGLTCCYLQRYQEGLKTPSAMKMGTVVNMQSWIAQYDHWQGKYRDEHFNYHNQDDFSLISKKLDVLAVSVHKKK